jgi:serine/threonine protein phosphatase PrpC
MPRDSDQTADRTRASAPVRVVLLGREHTSPGAMATDTVDARTAVGLARGWRPKPYAYVDPNEDAVGIVADTDAQLLVVADGHNGHRASHEAVAVVVDELGDRLAAVELSDDVVVTLIGKVEQRISQVVAPFGPRTRTTLVVALRRRQALQWLGVGDSALLIVGSDTRELPAQTGWFCGDQLAPAAVHNSLARGHVAVAPNAWVVLATDGYTDYLPVRRPPAEATKTFLRGVTAPATAVDALLRQARRGGAGDNVAVAVSGPW